MGVSKNRGTPRIINFNRVFHYKPSIFGGLPPLFLETPICYITLNKDVVKSLGLADPSFFRLEVGFCIPCIP